ncbi:hypothetical protein [Acinetobacter sp.]|uniref:hypothetical protein n=1 Tax=Acinetobacter sp. TaxID=472 RepID=UPI002FDA78D9
MYFGFTGKSLGIIDKVVAFLKISRKALYLILDVIGTAFIGIGAAWLTSKGVDQYSTYWDFSWIGMKTFILSPIFLILIGLILYAIAKSFQWIDNNQLFVENNNLNNKNNSLEQQMRGITEDKEILNKKLELAYRELVITWLSTTMKKLNINDSDTRATVYYCKDNQFYYVGRYSTNPQIGKANTNRVILNGGVISKAWTNREHIDLVGCPVFEQDQEAYYDYQNHNYGFSREKITTLGMKPCQYYAKRIDNRLEPIGIIVFECNRRNFNDNRVRTISKHCTEYESNLIGYIEKVREKESSKSSKDFGDVEKEFLDSFEEESHGK